jgi:hypothetical protein
MLNEPAFPKFLADSTSILLLRKRTNTRSIANDGREDPNLHFHQFGSLSILAHLILILPHPLTFSPSAQPPTSSPPATGSSHHRLRLRPRLTLLYRPLASISSFLAPTSKIYRSLTPQFKVFLHMSAMTLGGCIWAEKRVGEYLEVVRKERRAERRAEMERRGR